MAFSANFSDITDSSAYFSASFTGGDSSYDKYRYVLLEFDDGSSYEIKSTSSGGSSSSFRKTISGLDSETTYYWTATLGYIDSGEIVWLSLDDSGFFTTEKYIPPIAPWSWTVSNGEATSTMTQNAYAVLTGTLTADKFSHYVWNDLVDKVMEMRTYTDGEWGLANGKYLTYPNCKVAAGDALSAAIYNSVKYQIGSIEPTDILDVSSGDKLTGYHIIHIADVLNTVINNL